jgi:hypothetical protein
MQDQDDESIPEQRSSVTGDSTRSQSRSVQHQSAETAASLHFNHPFKSFIFALGIVLLILTPTINAAINPSYVQNIYSNAPFWYTPWAVFTITAQIVVLLIAILRRKRFWVYIFFLLAGVAIVLEITVLKPIRPEVHFAIRLVTIGLVLSLIKSKWRLFS